MKKRFITIIIVLAMALMTPINVPISHAETYKEIEVNTQSQFKKKIKKLYKKVKKGMTYKKVKKILMNKGDCYQKGSWFANYEFYYSYKENDDLECMFASICVSFEHGKVVDKSYSII